MKKTDLYLKLIKYMEADIQSLKLRFMDERSAVLKSEMRASALEQHLESVLNSKPTEPLSSIHRTPRSR